MATLSPRRSRRRSRTRRLLLRRPDDLVNLARAGIRRPLFCLADRVEVRVPLEGFARRDPLLVVVPEQVVEKVDRLVTLRIRVRGGQHRRVGSDDETTLGARRTIYRWFSLVTNFIHGFFAYLSEQRPTGLNQPDRPGRSVVPRLHIANTHRPRMSSNSGARSMSYFSRYAYRSSVPSTLVILTSWSSAGPRRSQFSSTGRASSSISDPGSGGGAHRSSGRGRTALCGRSCSQTCTRGTTCRASSRTLSGVARISQPVLAKTAEPP